MATNPMKRKSNISFLLGMLVMLLISGCIIALLLLQIKKMNEEANSDPVVTVCTLNRDVKSGQEITSDMITLQQAKKSMIPNNATSDYSVFTNYKLTTADGYDVKTDSEGMYITISGTTKTRLYKETASDDYYILTKNAQTNEEVKEYIKLNTSALIAKIDMNANTVMTLDMVAKSDETITDDVRRQEYNCVVLPIDLTTNDYIDIRLMLPNGQDFIVLAKKQVTIPKNSDGTLNEDTIWMNLSEDEILSMSSAIVEAYQITGAKLYATVYTDPGMQEAATPTYPINKEVYQLLKDDPNVLDEAKNSLYARYTQEYQDIRNNYIVPSINAEESAKENYQTNMQESITNTKEDRQKYLQSITTD